MPKQAYDTSLHKKNIYVLLHPFFTKRNKNVNTYVNVLKLMHDKKNRKASRKSERTILPKNTQINLFEILLNQTEIRLY